MYDDSDVEIHGAGDLLADGEIGGPVDMAVAGHPPGLEFDGDSPGVKSRLAIYQVGRRLGAPQAAAV